MRSRSPAEFTIRLWRLLFIVATATLMIAWLTMGQIGNWAVRGFRPASDCSSLGRAGVRCVARSAPDGDAGSEKDCVSAGRGGRIC